MTKINNNSTNVAAAIVEAATTPCDINAILAPHVQAGELVIRMEFNLSGRNKPTKGSTLNSFGGGGIYKYLKNPDKAFMTQCPMGFTLTTKGDNTSTANYFNNGEWARITSGESSEDSEELLELKTSLEEAEAMLKTAAKPMKPKIQEMIAQLKEEIESFPETSLGSEIMTYDDWQHICQDNGMETGELKLWFPIPWDKDDINDFVTDRELVAIRVYFLLSNVNLKSESIYPRMSNKNEMDTLLSTNTTTGVERHGLQLTVTPLHMEFLDQTFHHTKQLRMADPTGFNKSAAFFAAKDKAKKESPAVTFEPLTPVVEQLNIRAKKLPQCQAKLEASLEENNVWLTHIEGELKMIAESNQFFSFRSAEYNLYIADLKEKYPTATSDAVVIKESELKKIVITKPVIKPVVAEAIVDPESISPLDVEEDEIDALLASMT